MVAPPAHRSLARRSKGPIRAPERSLCCGRLQTKLRVPVIHTGCSSPERCAGHLRLCSFAWTLFAFLHNIMSCLAKEGGGCCKSIVFVENLSLQRWFSGFTSH